VKKVENCDLVDPDWPERWWEELAGRVAARVGGKHIGVNGRGRKYVGKAVAGKEWGRSARRYH
jgi:hypothetical protein